MTVRAITALRITLLAIACALSLSNCSLGGPTSVVITFVKGDVGVVERGRSVSLRQNQRFRGDANFKTGRGSYLEIKLEDGTLLRLGQNTKLRMSARQKEMMLEEGTVLITFSPKFGGAARGTVLLLEHDPAKFAKLSVRKGELTINKRRLTEQKTLVERGRITIPGLITATVKR